MIITHEFNIIRFEVCNIGESRFHIEECIEITEPGAFRQSAQDKDLTVVENIDSVVHVETNVVNDVPCLLNCLTTLENTAVKNGQ